MSEEEGHKGEENEPVLSREDALLHSAAHGTKHGWRSLKWLVDLAADPFGLRIGPVRKPAGKKGEQYTRPDRLKEVSSESTLRIIVAGSHSLIALPSSH